MSFLTFQLKLSDSCIQQNNDQEYSNYAATIAIKQSLGATSSQSHKIQNTNHNLLQGVNKITWPSFKERKKKSIVGFNMRLKISQGMYGLPVHTEPTFNLLVQKIMATLLVTPRQHLQGRCHSLSQISTPIVISFAGYNYKGDQLEEKDRKQQGSIQDTC